MAFLRMLSDFVFRKRYPSAWARQEIEREKRWKKLRDDDLKREGREFANRRRMSMV